MTNFGLSHIVVLRVKIRKIKPDC